MKAITFSTFGEPEVLNLLEVPTPIAGPGEVLIKITHTSVNPVDWKIRRGYLKDFLPHRFPIIPGWDAAGTVAALGSGASGFAVGDRVYAYTRLPEVKANGTYAEFIALPASAVALAPKTLSDATAGGVPLVALTAWQALHDVAAVKPGDRVFVTGGSGGVGSYAVQFAKLAGAHVTAAAGPANQAYLHELGASRVVDYTKGGLTADDKFDVVIDTVGGQALADAEAQHLAPKARVVGIVDTPAKGVYHFVQPNGPQLAKIAALFDAGQLKAPPTVVRSVKDAAAAQAENALGRTRGKVVLAIDF